MMRLLKKRNWKGKWGAISAAVGTVVGVVAQIIKPDLPSEQVEAVFSGVGRLAELLFGGGAALSLFGLRQAQGVVKDGDG